MARFVDIIGQEQIKEHLQNALKLNKVSHAYILNGEKSSGKEFIAKVFASALQCEREDMSSGMPEPCGECHSCKQGYWLVHVVVPPMRLKPLQLLWLWFFMTICI